MRLQENVAAASVDTKVKVALAILPWAGGPDVIVVAGYVINAKVAVIFFGEFITTVRGLVVPERSPVNPVKRNPDTGIAVIVTDWLGLR